MPIELKRSKNEISVGIIGGGPAGLTAAYHLTKFQIKPIVFEADPEYLGGIAKTAQYKGFCFDIGGHRFFSKSKKIEDFWTEILPHDLLERPRSSRILYQGKFYSYPLKAFEALFNLGAIQSCLCVISFLVAKAFPTRNPKSFQDWVINQFGNRLYRIFFKTYTEKVWGMDCKDISADWAAQRIKGLSLGSAILNALLPKRTKSSDPVIKTLIESFRYPRKGPGMLWDECAKKTIAQGGSIQMGARVTECHWNAEKMKWTLQCELKTASVVTKQSYEFDHIISSAPIRTLVQSLSPSVPEQTLAATKALHYRDFLIVVLILKDQNTFPDNWIYIHDPGVRVGRIQNFKSWSPEMVPDPELTCYGLEYFCFEGDGLWNSSDSKLIELAKKEIEQLKIARADEILDGCVVRQEKAYPVYDDRYAENVEVIKNEILKNYPGLHLVGRNGMHKYNNQDHSMMTALLTAENIVAGRTLVDPWMVNQDAEYHETVSASELSTSGQN